MQQSIMNQIRNDRAPTHRSLMYLLYAREVLEHSMFGGKLFSCCRRKTSELSRVLSFCIELGALAIVDETWGPCSIVSSILTASTLRAELKKLGRQDLLSTYVMGASRMKIPVKCAPVM